MKKRVYVNMLRTVLLLFMVGLLWGVTNPFIRLASQGIESINSGSRWSNLVLEFKTINQHLHYWIPFLLNQCGSLVYVITLQNADMIMAVPIANSLTFMFTAITGYLLGEKMPAKNVLLGTFFVCVGCSFLIYGTI